VRGFIRRIILYINGLAAAGLLACYFTSFISPELFWPIAFFNLLYPFFLLVNILFVVLWLYRKKWFFLISLVAVLAGWNYLTSFYRIKLPENTFKQNEFTVLSYNIRSFNRFNQAKNKNAKKHIYHFLDTLNANIICLQEFYTDPYAKNQQHLFNEVLEHAPYKTISYIGNPTNNYGYGIATFSTFPVVQEGSIYFENSNNRAVYSDIRYNNDTIRVYNCHLQSVRINEENMALFDTIKVRYSNQELTEMKNVWQKLKLAYQIRAKQADLLHRHIQGSPHPVIVCGDFNDTPLSYTYSKVRGPLQDAFLVSGKGLGNTYVRKLPGFRIDYILHDTIFESSGFTISRNKWSDHYPILTHMSYQTGLK